MSGQTTAREQSQPKSSRGRRRLCVEVLEARQVLSADLAVGLGPEPASLDLTIRGTEIHYSPAGLPSLMAGDLYSSAPRGAQGSPIGRYQEVLSPILMDINGDQMPDFVGTTGVATFSFFATAPRWSIGSFTTENTSYIQSALPTGQLVVASQGTIVDSAKALSGIEGSFVSQSVVTLAPSYEMQTSVHFTLTAREQLAARLATLAIDGWEGARLTDWQASHGLPLGEEFAPPADESNPCLEPKFVDRVLDGVETLFEEAHPFVSHKPADDSGKADPFEHSPISHLEGPAAMGKLDFLADVS